MRWDIFSRSVAIAAVVAGAGLFNEAAMAQSDAGAMCWVNTGTGKVYGGTLPALPDGTTETSAGQRSGDGHEYAEVPCPPPGLPQPAPRTRAAPAPDQ